MWLFDRLFVDKHKFQLFFTVGIFLSMFAPGHAVISILIISYTLYSLLYFRYRSNDISRDKFVWCFIFYCIYLLISGLWAEDKFMFLEKIRTKSTLVAIPFCFLIFRQLDGVQFKKLSTILCLVFGISAIYVAFHYSLNSAEFQQNLFLGQHIPVPFRSHIRYSILIDFCLLISLMQFEFTRKKTWMFSSIFFFIFLLFLSVKIGVLSACIILTIYFWHLIVTKKQYKLGLGAILGSLILFLIFFYFSPTFSQKLAYFQYDLGQYLSGNAHLYSDGERIQSIKQGIKLIQEHPILGLGEGNAIRYMGILNKLPHNQFILTWVQNGVLGFLLFCTLFILYFSQNRHWQGVAWGLSILAAVIVEPMLETQIGVCVFTLSLLCIHSYNHPPCP